MQSGPITGRTVETILLVKGIDSASRIVLVAPVNAAVVSLVDG